MDKNQQKLNDELLILASRDADSDELLKCINDGADTKYQNEDGVTALMLARRSFENLFLLTQKGADVNAQDKFGQTALHYVAGEPEAAYTSDFDAFENAKFLIRHKADVLIKDSNDKTACDYAKVVGNTKLADYLAEYAKTLEENDAAK